MFDDPVLERKLWDSCAAMWYTCTQKHEPRVVSTPVSEVERARQLEQQGYFVIPQVAPDKAEKIARDIEEHLALHGSRYANAMGGAVLGGWYIGNFPEIPELAHMLTGVTENEELHTFLAAYLGGDYHLLERSEIYVSRENNWHSDGPCK